MVMLSDSRIEKNLQNGREEFVSNKKKQMNIERVSNLKVEIEREAAAAIDCIEHDFLSLAKTKIRRIEILKDKIRSINNK